MSAYHTNSGCESKLPRRAVRVSRYQQSNMHRKCAVVRYLDTEIKNSWIGEQGLLEFANGMYFEADGETYDSAGSGWFSSLQLERV